MEISREEPVAEASGATTFRSPWVLNRVFVALTLVLVEVVIARDSDAVTRWILGLIITVPFLFARQRKIVITRNEVIYWPPLGARQTYRFSEITAITPTLVREFGLSSGVRFDIAGSSMPASIPLDFRVGEHKRVLDAITTAWKDYAASHASGAGKNPSQPPS